MTDSGFDPQAVDSWRSFGIRPLPSMSARVQIEDPPPFVAEPLAPRLEAMRAPFAGITAKEGDRVAPERSATPADTRPITDAASAFLQSLSDAEREQVSFTVDADEWRHWFNVHMSHFRHGLMLEDLSQDQRDLALGLLQATLSARGFNQARSIMRLNELLAEVSGDVDAFGEWPYFVSIFGVPGDGPWGWQIDGHHLCLNAVVLPDRLVLSPAFMGAEPRRVQTGRFAGISVFDPEEAGGLDLIRSLDDAQRSQAIVYPSIYPDAIPLELQNLFDGRMAAGATYDNVVLPYQGIDGASMSDAQRQLMRTLLQTYIDWRPQQHAAVRMSEIDRHLDETWFSWYGGYDDRAPFYYRLHSPVVLVEFDHHPGVVFDNDIPSRNHIHTLVRTPNGGDYGTDLLRQHHERFDHSSGGHRPRT